MHSCDYDAHVWIPRFHLINDLLKIGLNPVDGQAAESISISILPASLGSDASFNTNLDLTNPVSRGVITFHGNPGDYIAALIEDDRRRRAKARLESLLLEGLQSEAIEMTDKDWDEMRQQYDERHARSKAQ